jgi:hypothetical protein
MLGQSWASDTPFATEDKEVVGTNKIHFPVRGSMQIPLKGLVADTDCKPESYVGALTPTRDDHSIGLLEDCRGPSMAFGQATEKRQGTFCPSLMLPCPFPDTTTTGGLHRSGRISSIENENTSTS